MSAPPEAPVSERARWVRLGLAAALGLLVLFAVQALLVRPYGIPSESMEPTLMPGEGILVNRLAYRLGDPERGDLAVFHPPVGALGEEARCGVPRPRRSPCPEPTAEHADEVYVKRIVALPGERVAIAGGAPVVNGEPLTEDFATIPCRAPSLCELPREIVVPADHYFVMGDHRGGSIDSRHWGPVPREWLVGQAFLRYWPPGRLGGIKGLPRGYTLDTEAP